MNVEAFNSTGNAENDPRGAIESSPQNAQNSKKCPTTASTDLRRDLADERKRQELLETALTENCG
jgi:hypothetical protein